MVLYYNKVKKQVDLEPNDRSEETHNLHAITTTTQDPIGPRASINNKLPFKQRLFDQINKTSFSDRNELYYSLMEDNFNNLSIDDKLVVMYRTSIIRSNITNNYILMCLAILIIISLKLYSK